ncbi:MAG: hypothetical protein ABSG37_05100 [Candidatus Limnocylindrales bacterium]|jgi:hypothetical protein
METLKAADRPVARALQRRWREAEGAFFAHSFAEPGLYEASVKLVRGLADGLRDLTSEADLEAAYSGRDQEWAEGRLAGIDVPYGDWPDLDLALDAAFNLRLNELRGEVAARTTAARLAAARDAGETWLTSADGEVGIPGQRTYRRVDIHTSAGLALYGYSAQDWDRGETYWLEVLRVDPDNGTLIRGAPLLRRPRAYPDRGSLDRAFVRARRRFAGGQ